MRNAIGTIATPLPPARYSPTKYASTTTMNTNETRRTAVRTRFAAAAS